jgi:hypothetical protein
LLILGLNLDLDPDPELDPDPHSSKSLYPDPYIGNECGSETLPQIFSFNDKSDKLPVPGTVFRQVTAVTT